MFSTSTLAALAAFPLALAHYHSPEYNTTSTYSAIPTKTANAVAVQTVSVGKDGLVFTPDTITAQIGEKITFQFFPKNHSVVQADFANPCKPSENGIFSGFIPSADGPAEDTFSIIVGDNKPVWLYCAALLPRPHCAAGMVAVINPPKQGPNTLDAFRELAKGTNTSTAPGGPSSVVGSQQPGESEEPEQSTGTASLLSVSGGAMGLVALVAAVLL